MSGVLRRRPLVDIDDALRAALRQGPVVTDTLRLARETAYALDHEALAAGRAAWAAPDVLSVGDYLARCYAEAQDAGIAGAEPVLLPDAVAVLAMARAAPDESARDHAKTFATAWRLARLHDIPSTEPRLADTGNGRLYARWARSFERLAATEGWITAAELADRLVRLSAPGAAGADWRPRPATRIVVDGAPAAAIDRFLRMSRSHSLELPPRPAAERLRLLAVDTAKDELALASVWARERLAADPEARIGIVASELGGAFPATARRFHALFPDVADASAHVNVSGGIPLTEEPLCRDALALLRFCAGGLPRTELAALAQSPFLRTRLPALPTGGLPAHGSLDSLAAQHDAKRLSELLEARDAGRAERRWSVLAARLLRIAAFPGPGLSSRERQAEQRFERCLETLALAERTVGIPNWPDAVAALQQTLGSSLFAPQSANAPVQVIGRAESSGLAFDHLWLVGMNHGTWPPVPQPNPLLPLPLQRRAGAPQASYEGELERARATTQAWRHAAADVVASSSGEFGASRLLVDFERATTAEVVERPQLARLGHPWMARRTVALDAYTDTEASAPTSDRHRGGASLLKDQSQCPFRCWSRHRLGLGESRVYSDFPSPAERGTLLHETFAALARRFPSRRAMHEASAADVRGVIEQALAAQPRWPAAYRDHEASRIERLVGDWRELESRRRGDYRVQGVEQELAVDFAGLRLALRIDRIDAPGATPDDGAGQVLIDFKTGHASRLGWFGDRPQDPQLPLYAIALADLGGRVDAVALALVSADRCAFSGYRDPDTVADSLDAIDRSPDRQSMAVQIESWRARLGALAGEYLAGHAAVAPATRAVCNTCHLEALCRIFDDA